ncbi:hypothetical protein L227DRAFT_572499 [Lentinus tigrinus ALCF2SS1-6]|uniref:Uncharacterized protein n=1 Tax=Lentinus tigrinus ALCF2SS1-6 TaxID=1328759 RepID=A0A5C2SJK3_9APHY|nr:hypothetical protein L227DRAFT_572499 [Lentinus tigrinus ALCF2SS1-6]
MIFTVVPLPSLPSLLSAPPPPFPGDTATTPSLHTPPLVSGHPPTAPSISRYLPLQAPQLQPPSSSGASAAIPRPLITLAHSTYIPYSSSSSLFPAFLLHRTCIVSDSSQH